MILSLSLFVMCAITVSGASEYTMEIASYNGGYSSGHVPYQETRTASGYLFVLDFRKDFSEYQDYEEAAGKYSGVSINMNVTGSSSAVVVTNLSLSSAEKQAVRARYQVFVPWGERAEITYSGYRDYTKDIGGVPHAVTQFYFRNRFSLVLNTAGLDSPSNLSASSSEVYIGRPVTLSWSAAAARTGNSETTYQLQRKLDNGGWSTIYTGADLSHTDLFQNPATKVTYRVRASSGSYTSDYSTELSLNVKQAYIQLTLPLAATLAINPSIGEVSSSIIIVENQSSANVALTFELIPKAGSPAVVAPDTVEDWRLLSAADTRKKIAFAVGGQWQGDPGATPVTVLKGAELPLVLKAKHGLAWNSSATLGYTLKINTTLS